MKLTLKIKNNFIITNKLKIYQNTYLVYIKIPNFF